MHFGVALPNYGRLAGPDVLTRVAREAEALGFASLWTTDHIIVPETQPEPYGTLIEALTTLAFLAGRTERIKLGASVIVMPQRNAVLVAKEVAALDVLSGGRAILGVGAGWSADEFAWIADAREPDAPIESHFGHRGKLLDEQIEVMRALWGPDPVSFAGRFHRFDRALFGPKPVQGAALPIWIGGNTEPAVRRAARTGDAWHPVGLTADVFAERAGQLRAARGDRTVPATLRIAVNFAQPAGSFNVGGSGQRQAVLAGDESAVRDAIEPFAAAGLEHLCAAFPMRDADELVAQLRRFGEKVLPSFA